MTITNLTQLHAELVRLRDEADKLDKQYTHRQLIKKTYRHAAELVSELIDTVTKARDEAGRDRDDPELTLDAKSQGFYNAQTYARILGADND